MNIIFVDQSNTRVKSISTSFDWVLFLFCGFLGIPCFVKGLIGEGIFCFILWFINLFGIVALLNGKEIGLYIVGIVGFLLTLYGIYLGVFGARMRAYKLIKKGYLIKDADNPIIRNQLHKWKIGDSVIKTAKTNSKESNSIESELESLKTLGELLKDGIITKDEFETKKREILSK